MHNNLGIALMGQGKIDEAIAEFRTAVQLEPESAKSHRNLADALASARQYDEAIDQFRRAARLDPTGAAHYDLGSLFLELDRTEEAIAEFRASLKLAPDSAQTHNNLGIALGDPGTAGRRDRTLPAGARDPARFRGRAHEPDTRAGAEEED